MVILGDGLQGLWFPYLSGDLSTLHCLGVVQVGQGGDTKVPNTQQ